MVSCLRNTQSPYLNHDRPAGGWRHHEEARLLGRECFGAPWCVMRIDGRSDTDCHGLGVFDCDDVDMALKVESDVRTFDIQPDS